MPDGDGSMLDHSIILFGSNMANSDAHNNDPLPQVLDRPWRRHQGRTASALSSRTRRTRTSWSRCCDRAGVPAEDFENFADSTGPFSEV